MNRFLRWMMLLPLACLAGCSNQDPDQPPVGSIEIKARGEGTDSGVKLPARANTKAAEKVRKDLLAPR